MNLETMRRSAMKKLGFPINKSSYPYISGDTYRDFCDYDLTSPDCDIERLMKEKFNKKLNIFISVNQAQAISEKILESNTRYFTWKLFVHNGDIESNPDYFGRLSLKVDFIYSVNWIGNHSKISALPQGLENKSYLRNGVPKDFKSNSNLQIPWTCRKNLIYASFNEKTNEKQRKGLLDSLSHNSQVLIDRQFKLPSEYRRTVMNSKFIISPPGNGSDCHRTWEAMYLGAVPIVLSDFWPFKADKLPVLVVNSWDEMMPIILNHKHDGFTSHLQIEYLQKNYIDKYFKPTAEPT